ncbi:replication protein P [Bacterioplanoides sp.]|uniref:replication protein P n=1 Tax=Bacterioplanoides sp. TaxID=2066072 RepID=UPI003AFF989D
MDNTPSTQLLNRVTQQLKQASSDSKTPAGKQTPDATVEQKEAINQIFELFRFNYHNQFLKAFPDYDTMIMAKRLWSRLLVEYSGEVIMRAAEKAVKESRFLPSVHEVLERCDSAEVLGLPNAYAAYIEACRAPSPKKEYRWSHPAVYFAGRASDWYFIANTPEDKAFPVYKRNYEILLKRIQNGEELEMEIARAIPETIEHPLNNKEQKQRLAALMKAL